MFSELGGVLLIFHLNISKLVLVNLRIHLLWLCSKFIDLFWEKWLLYNRKSPQEYGMPFMATLLFKTRYLKFICSLICFCPKTIWFLLLAEKSSLCVILQIILNFLLTSLWGFLIFNFVIHYVYIYLYLILKLILVWAFKFLLHFKPVISFISSTDLKCHIFTQYALIYTWIYFWLIYSAPQNCHSILVLVLITLTHFLFTPVLISDKLSPTFFPRHHLFSTCS